MKAFTVYDPATGDILRSGMVSVDTDVALQARAAEALLEGTAGDHIEDKVDLSVKQVVKRTVAEIAARRPAIIAQPDTMAVVMALLKAKGITVTAADLAAAHTAAATQ